jgi:L,D-transpeptidase catalytic domain
VGAHGGRSGGRRRRRAGVRAALTAAVVLVAVALLAGVGTAATPLLSAAPAAAATGSLLGGVTGDDDAGGFARDHGVPVPEVPPCLPVTRACVDLSTDHAWLLDKGQVVRGPVPIIPGDEDTPTPRGSFTVQWKAEEYTSREFLVQMPWSVFFADGGIAFHAGDPDSYTAGCVKLHDDDARAFYEFLQVGDPVQVV